MAVYECGGCGLKWEKKDRNEVSWACPGCDSSCINRMDHWYFAEMPLLAVPACAEQDRDMDKYGPEWIKTAFDTELSEIGEDVARLLNDWVSGIYHIQRAASKVDWKNPYWIEINLRGSLSTFDFDDLTRLVFLAHDYAMRVEIDPRRNGIYKLLFHRRVREGSLYQRHPTIEQAVNTWRKYHAEMVE